MMRYRFPSLLRSNNDLLQGLSGWFLMLISILIGWMVACTPAVTEADEPEAMQIAAYDIESGLKVGEVGLPEVLTGGSETERGLWLVDLEQESITAEALPEHQIQWVRPAPDGTIYVFGTTDRRLLPFEIRSTSPSMLWRLDGYTLESLAERPFTGYRQGWTIEEMTTLAFREAASTNMQYLDCPVTHPPKTPFIPPQPWPSQPPGQDQFWLGDSGLWTALPASGSWRQLALGEKFWWWSEAFDVAEDAMPDLTVTARRLDGDAPAYQVSEATNGYHESFNWAMLVGVQLASSGCWEFTGQYKGHELSFVLWVPPE